MDVENHNARIRVRSVERKDYMAKQRDHNLLLLVLVKTPAMMWSSVIFSTTLILDQLGLETYWPIVQG